MPAAWAGVAAAGISAVSSIAGSSGANNSVSSGSAQAQALDEAARAEGKANYGTAVGNVQPYISTGQNALSRYADFTGVNGTDAANAAMSGFQASPGYGYQVEQGLKAVDAGAASQGLLRSGATLKAEQTLGSNLANNDFSNYLGRLNTLSNVGLQGSQLFNQATGQYNDLLTRTTADQTGTITSAAGNQASLGLNQANTLSNLAGSAINSAQKNGLFDSGTTNLNSAGIVPSSNTAAGYSGAFSY